VSFKNILNLLYSFVLFVITFVPFVVK